MSYLRHIAACNRFDAQSFLPLRYRDRVIGMMTRQNIEALRAFPEIFEVSEDAVALKPVADDPATLTRHVEHVSRELVRQGLIRQFRNEPFAVAESWGAPVLFDIDRGAVPFFGTLAYGVHLNGYRRRGGSFDLWIGRRSPTKQVAPDKLDNIVAGGISAGHSVRETLIKEAGEEASMPQVLAAQANAAGAIAYRMGKENGIRNDVLFVFDLEVPDDFVPVINDGEIVRFDLMPLEECLRLVRDTDDFKFNVNLVLIDFAIRHGVIDHDHPEYLQLVAGLKQGLSGRPVR